MPVRVEKQTHRVSLAWWALVLVLVVIVGGFYLILRDVGKQSDRTAIVAADNRRLAREGEQAHDALCVIKADLRQRVAAGRKFLREHPRGIPGIPPATLRSSIANQQATLDALKPLACPRTPAQ